jgi:hypothetical protein
MPRLADRVGCPTLLPEKYLLKISIEETLVVGDPASGPKIGVATACHKWRKVHPVSDTPRTIPLGFVRAEPTPER